MAKKCNIIELDNDTAIGWDAVQKRFLHNGTKTTFENVKDAQVALKEIKRINRKSKIKTKYVISPLTDSEK